MNIKNKVWLIFFGLFLKSFSEEFTMEELNSLYNDKLISQEEYNILKNEINGNTQEDSGYYQLKINGKQVSSLYSVIRKDNKSYLALEEFLTLLNLNNYDKKAEEYKIYLGNSLEEVRINTKRNKVVRNGKNIDVQDSWYLMKNDKLYIEKDIFKELFLSELRIENATLRVDMYVNFATPEEVNSILNITADKLNNVEVEKEILYRGTRKLFDLGYTRIQLGESISRENSSDKYDTHWDGSLDYQGSLLYGEVYANFDLKERELGEVRLEYENVWKDHTFVVSNRKNDSQREWGLAFYKDEGFINDGKKIIIRETVPLGSRAELIYMGTPIAIEDEESGIVEFTNDMIVADRTYHLRVHTPDGKISEKEIRTTEDYNRQNKNEVKYDLNIDQNKSEHKYITRGNVYYGITDNFTLGGGYTRDIVDTDDGYKYFNASNLELVYGGVYNGYSYTFRTSGEKTFSSIKEFDKNLDDRYRYELLGEVRVGKYKYKLSEENYGKYYDEKKRDIFEFQYDILDSTRITYDYERTKRRDNISISLNDNDNRDKSQKLGFTHDFTWYKVLFGTSVKFDLDDSNEHEYSVNSYYGGWRSLSARLENRWEKSGKEYETTLSLYNNNFRGLFDVSLELGYSNMDKEKVTFKISMDIDNWLSFDSNITRGGGNDFRIGIDKVVDLKNPKAKLDGLDVSRVNVTTFIDSNNNNIFDKDEIVIDGVEVMIGDQKIITDKDGRGTFYNISNGLLHDLKPTIKKPAFTIGNNKIRVLSNVSSTVEAFIPVKPMINLHGMVELDKVLGLDENEKEAFYSDILIEIKDENGKTIELVAPDNTGMFDVSGLFPNNYYIEVSYTGTKYDIKSLLKEMKLDYRRSENIDGFEHRISFNVTNKTIKLTQLI